MIPDYAVAERSLARAQADGAAMIAAAPGDWRAHSVTALAWQLQVGIDAKHNRDTRPALKKLLAAIKGQLGLQSGLGLQKNALKYSMQYTLGEAQFGADPRKELARAEGFLKVYEDRPTVRQAGVYDLGKAWMQWGKRQKNAGENPTKSLLRAVELFDQSTRVTALATKVIALSLLVKWENEQGKLHPGHTAMAIAAARRAEKALPRTVEIPSAAGVIYANLDRWDDALAAYERALRLKPNDVNLQRLAAFARSKLGR